MRREPNIHSAPAKNSPCLSVNNPTDGDDLELRFGVCHIIGVIELHLTAAHADALTVDKHVETIFIHHGLPITLMDGLGPADHSHGRSCPSYNPEKRLRRQAQCR